MNLQSQVIGFAQGCFWSKEYFWQQVPGVLSTRVGFAGGHATEPTYKQVCTKTTGHAETVEVTYDPAQVSLQMLLGHFFLTHNATIDRRGKGGQYRSAVFFTNAEQEALVEQYIQALEQQDLSISTERKPLDVFWPADKRHQNYCSVRGWTPEVKSQTPMKTKPVINYQPINCDFYDHLEIAAMRKQTVEIELDATIAGQDSYRGIIEDLRSEGGVEYMFLENGLKVRLDAIQTFNGQPLPKAC